MTENDKDRVGAYELLDLIGDGAQGRVYKACYRGEDVSKVAQGEIVAIKLIRITGDDDKLRTKFQAQADILRHLSHNNIVRYRDSFAWHAGEWDEAQCLVMEFLEGEPLSERLKKASTGLPWSQVEGIFEQCLAGLIHARERGITHRDIKPSNLFITTDGQTKVIDFDIARRDDSGQMSTAGWKGTFDYMAPDFITIPGFRGDELSDIFSLGVCFYQALAGTLPFEPLGDSAHIGYLNRWKDGAAPAPSFRPGVFRVLSNAKPFVAKCLAAKREHRYQSFAAMLEDFRKIRARRIRHKNKDEYELLAVLGRGGFGEVFKARKISDGSLVAVKHLFAEKQSERFIKEAKILQQYPHPNLCKYVDFMVVDGTAGEKQYFLILEFLEGMPGWTLRTRLKNEGRLEASEAIPLFIGYLSALQYLHENSRPIIHRDIKPGNLYAPLGQPEKGKIFDLGVARDVSGTVTVGGVPGTLDYMPPEFAEAGGDRGSPQSDLYALGLCLYESLAGRPVYDRLPTDLNSAWVAFQKRLRKPLELTFESDAFRQYPRLKTVILKSLAPRPVDRYESAARMKQDIENILAGKGYDDADESNMEMTNATLHSFAEDDVLHPPEPGATRATRPLDDLEATQLAPAGLLAAGKAEAERRKRRKRLIITSAVAAGGLLVLGLGGGLIYQSMNRQASTLAERLEQAIHAVEQTTEKLKSPAPSLASVQALRQAYNEAVKTGQRYPQLGERIDEQCRLILKAGSSLPAEFKRNFDAALKAEKTEQATGLLKEWETLAADANILGLTEPQFKERRDAMNTALQASEDAVFSRYLTQAQGLARQAKSAFDADQADNGLKAQKNLTELIAQVPERFEKKALTTLLAQGEERYAALQSRQSQALAVQRKLLLEAGTSLGELRGHIRKGDLSECVDGVTFLATPPPTVMANPEFKAQRDLVLVEFEKLIEKVLAQKDPLDKRAQRLKTVGEILNAPAAEQVFSGKIKLLRESLTGRQQVFVLRVINQAGEPIRISGPEIKDKLLLARDAMQEFEIPVHSANSSSSILIEGDATSKPRIEAVTLASAGGREWIVTPLEKEAVKIPVVQTVTSRPPDSSVSTSVSNPPPLVVKKNAVSDKAALEITVSPKNATITVDGNAIKAGRVEVAPHENHKVIVEAPGYTASLQYYRVKAGETRKIDILLEKSTKKSFFGL